MHTLWLAISDDYEQARKRMGLTWEQLYDVHTRDALREREPWTFF